jgi:hypothetical protein
LIGSLPGASMTPDSGVTPSSSTSTLILMSPVVIILRLTPSAASAWNMRSATPAMVRIPAPTTDTLLTFPVSLSVAPSSATIGASVFFVLSSSELSTVKPIVALPPSPTLWAIMSTAMFASASALKTRWLTPGRSGTPSSTSRASSAASATPHAGISLIHGSSGTIQVPIASDRALRTISGTSNFLANSMERECITPAPMLAISSISS